MRLFDTLTRSKKEFVPLHGKHVGIYTCGPSVYAYSHIGNFRTYLFEDILVRYLRFKGYMVRRVINITDIEDKALEEAKLENTSLRNLQRDKIRAFFSDWRSLGITEPEIVAKASDHVPHMIELIKKICRNGYCKMEKDGIYFDIRKFRKYGMLSRLKNMKYFGRSTKDDYAKSGLWDFRLWKNRSRRDGNTYWNGELGKGRPGWHIECSAMAMHYLGSQFDIHCGGTDNIYPHHENEIAQAEAATGKLPAKFWLHASHLTVNKKKMSKRTGNVFYVKQLRGMGVPSMCLRYYLISEHYRKPLDFSPGDFAERVLPCHTTGETIEALRRLSKTKGRDDGDGRTGKRIAKKMITGFENAMDDDLNTKLAFKRIFRECKAIRKQNLTALDAQLIVKALDRINAVLGVL